MLSRKYLEAVRRLESQTPDLAEHEIGQPVLSHEENVDEIKSDTAIQLAHTLDDAGNLRLTRIFPEDQKSLEAES
jgi:hypothetical protein